MMFKLTKEVAPVPAHKIEVEVQLPLYLRVDPQMDYEDTYYFRFDTDKDKRVYYDRVGVDRWGRTSFLHHVSVNTIPAGSKEISSNEYHDHALNKLINSLYETLGMVKADLFGLEHPEYLELDPNFQPSN